MRGGRIVFSYWIIVAIFLLQNGPLRNSPIVLLILLIPAFDGLIFRKPGQCEKIVLLYGMYLLVITLLNVGNNFDLKYTTNILIQYFIIYISLKFSLVKIGSENLLFFFRNFGLVMSILCLVEAICNKHIWASFLGKELSEGSARVVGIFNHPIVCACFLLITLILIIVFPISKKTGQLIALNCIVLAIILTQSRSTWIATIFVLIIYFLKFHKYKFNRTYFIYGLLIIGLAFIISIVMQYNFIAEITNFVSRRIRGSLQAGEGHIVRIEIILNSFQYWKNHIGCFIFGQGKNYGLIYLKYNPILKFGTFKWDAAIDNQYVTLIYETGLIGLFLILSIVVIAFKNFIKATSTDKIQIAVSLCIIGNAICMFFYEGLNYPVMVLMYMIFILLSDSQKSCMSKRKFKKNWREIDEKQREEYSNT